MVYRAKIGAGQKPSLPYDYDRSLNMHLLGPGELATGEWRAAGLRLPRMDEVRRHRLARVRAELQKRNYAAIVLADPLNIRYASDATNMQLWTAHDAARYCFVGADKLAVFDYRGCEHLSAHNRQIDEVRPATSWFYFSSGSRLQQRAEKWAAEIADMAKAAGGKNPRIAIDKCNPEGADALRALGVTIGNGEEVMENARLIKCEDEILAMRCAIYACDRALDAMRKAAVPGATENEVWAVMHAENIKRGGEWIETRLLSAGPRTNPWFQECSSRPMMAGELLSFDTDLIGAYGICVDISRAWLVGGGKPSSAQKDLHERAVAQVRENAAMLRPGMTFEEAAKKALCYPPQEFRNYGLPFHGIGLCDEYPSLPFGYMWDEAGHDGIITEGMTVCCESYVGRQDGGEGVKYEDQYHITKNGAKLLSDYPSSM
ncbi:MAG: M24 family metallopeptidase [Gammaproteobacteria bacterium]